MKKRYTILLLVVALLLTVLPSCSMGERKDERLIGRWRTVSCVSDSGAEADIENNLDMVLYSTGIGTLEIDGEIQLMFDYTAYRGKLTRIISGELDRTVEESYTLSKDGNTITIYAPADRLTMVMVRVTPDEPQK